VVAIAGIAHQAPHPKSCAKKGAQNGALLAGSDDADRALRQLGPFPGSREWDLAKVVTTTEPYEWSRGGADRGGFGKGAGARFHVVAYDYGVKRNILRMLVERGCSVTVLPAQTRAEEASRST